jgi:hypothetical protein
LDPEQSAGARNQENLSSDRNFPVKRSGQLPFHVIPKSIQRDRDVKDQQNDNSRHSEKKHESDSSG